MTDKPAHRIYHGITDDDSGTNARILVVAGGGGPTERERDTKQLYQLTPKEPFWWGYGGSSPGRAAEALLNDVLPEVRASGHSLADLPRELRSQLTVAFISDFLAHFHDREFWLPARTVVRWIQGFLRELQNS